VESASTPARKRGRLGAWGASLGTEAVAEKGRNPPGEEGLVVRTKEGKGENRKRDS